MRRFGLRGWRLKPSPQSLHETTCHHDLFYSLCPGSLPFLSRHTRQDQCTQDPVSFPFVSFLFVSLYSWSGSLPASVLGDGGGVPVPVCVALRCVATLALPLPPPQRLLEKFLGWAIQKLILLGDRFLLRGLQTGLGIPAMERAGKNRERNRCGCGESEDAGGRGKGSHLARGEGRKFILSPISWGSRST